MKKPYVTMSLVVISMDINDIVRMSSNAEGTTVLNTDNAGLWDEAW